jgi:phosphoadenosine phosphosulfate reductase
VVEWDAKFGLVKVNPPLHWTPGEVWEFILAHEIPCNPLHDRGYPGIGCWPCTERVELGGEERAGRWTGTRKTECGLHVIERETGSKI